MGWYNSAWTRRWAVTVDNSAGSASGDVEIAVPVDWDGWDVIQADGDDIRVTTADGQTLASYALSGFDYAARTVTIQVDGVTLSGTAGMDLLWIYAGNGSATDASSAVTITSAKTGYIETGAPSLHTATAMPEVPGVTRPRRRIQKTADEEVYVWIRLDHLLTKKVAGVYQKHRQHEEVRSVVMAVHAAGVAQATMINAANQRFVETKLGQFWVKVHVRAGASGTNYTAVAEVRTVVPTNTAHQLLEPRVYLAVKDVSEV